MNTDLTSREVVGTITEYTSDFRSRTTSGTTEADGDTTIFEFPTGLQIVHQKFVVRTSLSKQDINQLQQTVYSTTLRLPKEPLTTLQNIHTFVADLRIAHHVLCDMATTQKQRAIDTFETEMLAESRRLTTQ